MTGSTQMKTLRFTIRTVVDIPVSQYSMIAEIESLVDHGREFGISEVVSVEIVEGDDDCQKARPV